MEKELRVWDIKLKTPLKKNIKGLQHKIRKQQACKKVTFGIIAGELGMPKIIIFFQQEFCIFRSIYYSNCSTGCNLRRQSLEKRENSLFN